MILPLYKFGYFHEKDTDMPFLIIAGIVIIIALIALAVDKIEDFFIYTSSFWAFLGNNIFAFFALLFLFLAVIVLIYFKPHPAEKYFKSYKKGEITRRQAIEDIANTMYNSKTDHVPPAYKSKMLEKRISALRKRVKAETEFIEQLIGYMKTRSMIE